MLKIKDIINWGKIISANKQILKVNIPLNLFLARYISRFSLLNIDGNLIIHSHLPALTSKAFTRFVDEQLLGRGKLVKSFQIIFINPQACREYFGDIANAYKVR